MFGGPQWIGYCSCSLRHRTKVFRGRLHGLNGRQGDRLRWFGSQRLLFLSRTGSGGQAGQGDQKVKVTLTQGARTSRRTDHGPGPVCFQDGNACQVIATLSRRLVGCLVGDPDSLAVTREPMAVRAGDPLGQFGIWWHHQNRLEGGGVFHREPADRISGRVLGCQFNCGRHNVIE